MSNSDDERYKQELIKRRKEAEARLREEEEQQQAEWKAKRDEGGREKATGGRTEEASRGGTGMEESRRGRGMEKGGRTPKRSGSSY